MGGVDKRSASTNQMTIRRKMVDALHGLLLSNLSIYFSAVNLSAGRTSRLPTVKKSQINST